MSHTVLLVCGSRSLATSEDADLWAHAAIEGAVQRLHAGDVVLAGAARGPDLWARKIALAYGLRVVEYHADGRRVDWSVSTVDGVLVERHRLSAWCDDPPDPDPSMAPLVRNLAMLDALTTAQQRGWSVRVLGLVDSRSRTHGTEHTLRHAERRGIEVQREVWPPAEPPA